jgi:hypothetical protein
MGVTHKQPSTEFGRPWANDKNANSFRLYNLLEVGFVEEVDDGNSSTAATIDWTAGPFHKLTLTGNCALTLTAPTGVCRVQLKLVQDATGSRTVTWPATVYWPNGTAPTLTTTASAADIVSLYWDGTNYWAMWNGDFS